MLRQREQTPRPCLPTSGALGVIPTHGQAAPCHSLRHLAPGTTAKDTVRPVNTDRSAAPRTPPTLFFIVAPLLDAHLTHLRKVWQVLTTVQKTDSDEVRNAVARQLTTVSTTSIVLLVRRTHPDRAVSAMGRKLATAETTIAAEAIHPTRVRDRLEFIRRFR